MNIGRALASGLTAYMQTKDDQQLRDQRKQEADMRQAQFDAWQQDRQQAQQDRADRRALYDQIAGSDSSMQPTQETTFQPSTDPTKGVDLAKLGINQDGSAQAPSVSAGPIGSGLPEGTWSTKTREPDINSLTQTNNKLTMLQAQAYKLGDQNAVAMINQRRQALLGQWAGSYQGDPTTMDGALGYAQHIAQGAAVMGQPMSPEEAIQYAKVKKAYDDEGALKALQMANAGDKESALKLYNSTGNHKFADVALTPQKSVTGVPSYHITGVNADGSKVDLGNAFDNMAGLLHADERYKMYAESQKLDLERTRVGNEDRHNRAMEAVAATNSKRVAKANAPAQVQTAEWLVAHGVAKNEKEAWDLLGTSKEKSREAAITDLAGKIMSSGLVPADQALQQSTMIVDSVRGSQGGGNLPTFATEAEAEAAAKAGKLKPNTRVIIGGKPGTWK